MSSARATLVPETLSLTTAFIVGLHLLVYHRNVLRTSGHHVLWSIALGVPEIYDVRVSTNQ